MGLREWYATLDIITYGIRVHMPACSELLNANV